MAPCDFRGRVLGDAVDGVGQIAAEGDGEFLIFQGNGRGGPCQHGLAGSEAVQARALVRLDLEELHHPAAIPPRAGEHLQSHAIRFALVTLREVAQGEAVERAYQVTFKNDGDEEVLVSGLRELGATGVVLSLQEPSVEL